MKITLHDLPLHAVDNKDVLESLKEHCEVLLMVNYSNVWHNGKMTNIRNGDWFVYIAADDVSKISDYLDIGEYRVCVFKPKAVMTCKRYHKEGHCASDDSCPAKAPKEVQDSMEVFCGGKFPLSNLHKCPHGCHFIDKDGESYLSSEHHYQKAKLLVHDKPDVAAEVMREENPFKAMQIAQAALPDMEISDNWSSTEAKVAMSYTNAVKFHSCEYTMDTLLDSHPLIAEAMGNKYWGTRLHLEATCECLSEYWAGANEMGNILMQL